jgi:hypothetical protein
MPIMRLFAVHLYIIAKISLIFVLILDAESPEGSAGCELTPATLYRHCATQHHGQVSRAPRDPECKVVFSRIFSKGVDERTTFKKAAILIW